MTETKKLSELAETVTIETHLVGETVRDNDWKCDAWRCVLHYQGREMPVDYFMGLGCRKAPPGQNYRPDGHGCWMGPFGSRKGTPQPPSAADVLSSLLLDSSALDESFEAWAEGGGYDTDSRKALALYLACQGEGRKLQKLLGPDWAMFREAENDI